MPIDVRTGKRLWTYDPKVPREIGYKGCCDVVNRGVALYEGQGLRRHLRRPPDRA
jgi:glucose dehydrogenase